MVFLLIFTAVLAFNFFISLMLRSNFEQRLSSKLQDDAVLAGEIIKQNLRGNEQKAVQEKIRSLTGRLRMRITVVNDKGDVIADSEKDPALMGNHKDRPEIAQAIENGVGESSRFSTTLNRNMKYVAVRINDNNHTLGIVRFAVPVSSVQLELQVISRVVLLGGIITIVAALAVAYFISRSISRPIRQMQQTSQQIAKGDFSKKIDVRSKDELGELAKSLNAMADELQQKMESLRQLDRIRTDFVANVSHELRTPLTSIKGFIETLEDGAINDTKNAMRFVSIIKKHADRLENIINDLLSLSELELQKDAINKTDFDLKNLVEEIVLGFGHSLSAKNHKLTLDSHGRNFILRADADRIEQVFVNLIDNAIKYTREGGQIDVSLLEEDETITASIQDNGIGIAKEHLDRVFERFYRVDKARSRELGGTGLGLSIAKHIISAHNGKIHIESEVGRGTKVTLTLPKR